MKVVVDRSKWRYGGTQYDVRDGDTQLLNKRGLMCCLGFGCLQSGIEQEAILECSMPGSVCEFLDGECIYPDELEWLRQIQNDAAAINDSKSLTNEDREFHLKRVFKLFGHTIEFVGEYRDLERERGDYQKLLESCKQQVNIEREKGKTNGHQGSNKDGTQKGHLHQQTKHAASGVL